MVSDRFGMVLKKMSDGVKNVARGRKMKVFKMTGSIFAESGRFRIAFLAYSLADFIKNLEIQFPLKSTFSIYLFFNTRVCYCQRIIFFNGTINVSEHASDFSLEKRYVSEHAGDFSSSRLA